MVETNDGALYAHMGVADMAFPVLAALAHPERRRNDFGRLRLEEVGRLTFSAVDGRRYPALALCYAAGRRGGTLPAVLNAANEAAVGAFLGGRLSFTGIVRVVEKAIERAAVVDDPTLEDILAVDREAREFAERTIAGKQ